MGREGKGRPGNVHAAGLTDPRGLCTPFPPCVWEALRFAGVGGDRGGADAWGFPHGNGGHTVWPAQQGPTRRQGPLTFLSTEVQGEPVPRVNQGDAGPHPPRVETGAGLFPHGIPATHWGGDTVCSLPDQAGTSHIPNDGVAGSESLGKLQRSQVRFKSPLTTPTTGPPGPPRNSPFPCGDLRGSERYVTGLLFFQNGWEANRCPVEIT